MPVGMCGMYDRSSAGRGNRCARAARSVARRARRGIRRSHAAARRHARAAAARVGPRNAPALLERGPPDRPARSGERPRRESHPHGACVELAEVLRHRRLPEARGCRRAGTHAVEADECDAGLLRGGGGRSCFFEAEIVELADRRVARSRVARRTPRRSSRADPRRPSATRRGRSSSSRQAQKSPPPARPRKRPLKRVAVRVHEAGVSRERRPLGPFLSSSGGGRSPPFRRRWRRHPECPDDPSVWR